MIRDFDRESVVRIVRSMALAKSRELFVPGDRIVPAAMPPAARKELAAGAAAFFGFGDEAARDLEPLPEISQWAGYIHAASTARGHWTFIFSSSGSTGLPSPHAYGLEDLEKEAQALEPFFSGRKRVVSVMPVHHIFGFAFALMLPKRLNIPVRDFSPLPSADFFRKLEPGDFVLAFPIFWRSFLEMCSGPHALPCPPDVHGVTSGAPCPPEVIEGLLAGSRPVLNGMTEIYGATEFGAVGIRRRCRGPYTLLSHWHRVPLEDREWGIARINGPASPLPDLAEWLEECSFVPLGRKDKAVQVGGINVFPARVADLLRAHPDVSDCAVRLMRPEEGARLKAFVVPREGAVPGPALAGELRRWLAGCLDPASRPKTFSFGPRLPVTPSGKTADWNIAKLAG